MADYRRRPAVGRWRSTPSHCRLPCRYSRQRTRKPYRLLPKGPWARKYLAYDFGDFDLEEWLKIDPNEPGIRLKETPPELDPAEEWLLTRMVGDSDAEEWLLTKVRGVDEEAARVIEAAEDRMEGLRKLVEMGWEEEVLEIAKTWEMRKMELSDEQIARILKADRSLGETMGVLIQLGPKEMPIRQYELRVCALLLGLVVPDAYPWDDVIARAECDVEEAIRRAQEALKANDGQAAVSEEDFRGMVESRKTLEATPPREETIPPWPD